MFSFLNPTWLLAAAAVIIPLLIHLWNIRPGKVLKVGSTSLVTAASRVNSRSFKLLDILLLILRCLLLVLIASLLALPVWEKHLHAFKAKGWILLPKEKFVETYQHFQPTVDSLTKAGYQFHFFDTGFPQADLKILLAQVRDIKLIDTPLKQPSSYWALLKQLDARISSDIPVYLFTCNGISHFNGPKPVVGMNLHWKTFTAADSVSTWIQDAWLTNSDNIRVVKGTSNPQGTSYDYINLESDHKNALFTVNVSNGQPSVVLPGSKQAPVNVNTSVTSIAIFTDHYKDDAGYLKAALNAVAQFTQRKIIIKQYNTAAAIPPGQTWIFWLSDRPYPGGAANSQAYIFGYQPGKAMPVTSWISSSSSPGLPGGSAQVPLFKRINSATAGSVIWHDGFGEPVLSLQGHVYHFYSRFNPTWNDLVWTSDFPKLLLQLMAADKKPIPAGYDKRALNPEQITPVKIAGHEITDKFTVQTQLSIWLWILAALIFISERVLATKNKSAQTNG